MAAAYKWAVDLEICVFPQDGLTNYPGTDELLVAALKRGAPVLGGAPRYDSDPAAQIDRIFALAREYDVDLDLHLDVGDDPRQLHIYQVLALTERYQRGGRVVAGHMAKLSLLPPAEVAALARRLADAGIAVTVLTGDRPLSDGARARPRRGARRRRREPARAPTASPARCRATTSSTRRPRTATARCLSPQHAGTAVGEVLRGTAGHVAEFGNGRQHLARASGRSRSLPASTRADAVDTPASSATS